MLFVIEKKIDGNFTFVSFEKNKCKKKLNNESPK